MNCEGSGQVWKYRHDADYSDFLAHPDAWLEFVCLERPMAKLVIAQQYGNRMSAAG